uniref:Uncharacterized protein n=1 Tax=viral metagenome TaxID=1070528 RepID=A0A6H1ZFV2_9ZZZZ
MADWNNFLRTDDFRAYRKKQIEAVAANIKVAVRQIVTGGKVDLSELKGKQEMIKLFLKLPETLTNDKQTMDILSVQLDEDINEITKFLIRQSFTEKGTP